MTKNRRTHRAWLAASAIDLLREAKTECGDSPLVFASARVPSASVAARSKKAMSALRRCSAIAFDARRHDLRRTLATHLRAAGVERDTVAMVLNHELQSGGAATGHYDHYTGDAEKRDALTRWDRILTVILRGDAVSKVVAFTR